MNRLWTIWQMLFGTDLFQNTVLTLVKSLKKRPLRVSGAWSLRKASAIRTFVKSAPNGSAIRQGSLNADKDVMTMNPQTIHLEIG